MKIAVIPNLTKPDAFLLTERAVKTLLSLHAEALLSEERSVFSQSGATFAPESELYKSCDTVLCIGGDGTIIRCAKEAARYEKPVLGINVGRLGFVAGLEANELGRLSDLIHGEYTTEERMMLEVSLEENGYIKRYYALNDAVVARGTLSRILDLRVLLNESNVCDYRADSRNPYRLNGILSFCRWPCYRSQDALYSAFSHLPALSFYQTGGLWRGF